MALGQKEAKELREKLFGQMTFEGMTLEGRTKEGLAFSDSEQNIIVVKIVAKKDDFDLVDAMEEYEEAEEKAKAKELEKKAKEAKKKED
jgi:predicted RND superfamily exporter protein